MAVTRFIFNLKLLLWKPFVQIVVYADESGTHDQTGVLDGAREATICGIAALKEDWVLFSKQWCNVLAKYNAPYFHFREWNTASAVSRKKRSPSSDFKRNPYRDWTTKQLDELLIELATIAGAGHKLVLGGAVHTRQFHQAKMAGMIPSAENPYETCVNTFFESFLDMVKLQRRPWKRQPVSFIFDRSGNREWERAVIAAYELYRIKHPKFISIAFADKRQQVPLQAADMVAYRSRQITENWVDDDSSRQWKELDKVLFRSTFDFLQHHESSVLTMWGAGLLGYQPKATKRPSL